MTIRLMKKIGTALAIAALLAVAVGPAFVPQASAQAPSASPYSGTPGGFEKLNLLSCLGPSAALCPIYFLAMFTAFISGVFVGVGAFLVTLALNLNLAMLTTPAILAGFGVSLAVANLGFVLGIIVIAIATMLRLQSYGMKQLLVKLVAMAILINFSMVIAVSVIRFSDSLSIYFLQKVSPTAGASGFNKVAAIGAYANSMASAFAPQALFVTQEKGWIEKFKDAFAALNPAAMLKSIANLFFIAFFTLIVVVAFLALGIMLLIRYAYITILLVLMPLAWLLWVFPNFSRHFSDWWNKFLRWTFFPPIVLFFLYLAFFTMKGTGSAAFLEHIRQDAGVSEGSAAVGFFNKVLVYPAKDFLGGLVGMMIAGTLVFGGFFAANKFGVVGASAAMGSIKGLSKNAGKYVWSKGSGAAARYFGAPPAAGKARLPLQGLLAPRAIGEPLEAAERARIAAKEIRGKMKDATPERFEELKKEAEFAEGREKKLRQEAAIARAKILRGEEPLPVRERAPIWSAQGMQQRIAGAQEALSRTLLVHAARMETSPGLAKSLWQGATGGLFQKHKKLTKKELEEIGIHLEHEEGEEHPPAPPQTNLGGDGSGHHT